MSLEFGATAVPLPSFHFIRVRHGDSTTFETCFGLQWETLLKEDLMWEHESSM